MNPDFTIVTPSFNYGRFIGDCLRSVEDQQGVTLEHLVMDAGSRDDTAEVVARFPHASFFQEPDKGMSDGINKGFRRARGEWVMWLNADDRLKPGALKRVKEFIDKQPQADVVYGGWDYVDEAGKFRRRMTLFPFSFEILVYVGCYIGSTACFYRRRTTLDEGYLLDIDFHYCMDGEYYARLAAAGKRFEHLPEVLADFRLHGESISQRNLGAEDTEGVLRFQRQLAEPRTIRRIHGMLVSRNEAFNGIVDGVLNYLFRAVKWIRRRLAARSYR